MARPSGGAKPICWAACILMCWSIKLSRAQVQAAFHNAALAKAVHFIGIRIRTHQPATPPTPSSPQDGLVDLIFANEEEAVTLCTELGLLPPADGASAPDTDAAVEAAQRFLLSPTGGRCKVAVTSLGARGCVARAADGGHGAAAACRVQVVDTIGAGDFFTAGFLAAYLRGGSVQQCAAAGCASGAEAVQAKGAELPEEAFVRLRAAIDSILAAQPVAGGAAAAAAAAAGVAAAVAAVMGAGAGAGAKAVGMAAVAGSPAAAATAKPEPVAAMV